MMASPARLNYTLLGRPPYINLEFGDIAPDGQLLEASLFDGTNSVPINGFYVQGALKFNDASFPGFILLTTFFMGQGFDSPDGQTVLALSGEWHEQTITFDPTRKVINVASVSGAWVAINPQPIDTL